jgi:integrase
MTHAAKNDLIFRVFPLSSHYFRTKWEDFDMAHRLPKPRKRYRKNGNGFDWFVTIAQRQFRLGPDDMPADELQRLLLMKLAEANVCKPGQSSGFVAVMNRYLDHVKAEQSRKTYRIRSSALNSFRDYLQAVGLDFVLCKDLKPYHVTKWLAGHPSWGPNMRRMAILSLKTCLNWAYNQGILAERLLDRLKPPQEVFRGQEVILTPEQRQLLIDNCLRDRQRDVLRAMYATGCRPGEICSLRAEDVYLDWTPPVWVVRGKPTKHRADGVRHVALSPSMVEMSRKLLDQNPMGLLFRNRAGTAWHPGLIDAFVYRLRNRLLKRGHKLPPKVIPYGMRHNFATDLLGGGALDHDVSQLMGHAGTKMVHAVYSKHNVAKASRALRHLREVADGDGQSQDSSQAADSGQEPTKNDCSRS